VAVLPTRHPLLAGYQLPIIERINLLNKSTQSGQSFYQKYVPNKEFVNKNIIFTNAIQ
jgi:hypothetical protein